MTARSAESVYEDRISQGMEPERAARLLVLDRKFYESLMRRGPWTLEDDIERGELLGNTSRCGPRKVGAVKIKTHGGGTFKFRARRTGVVSVIDRDEGLLDTQRGLESEEAEAEAAFALEESEKRKERSFRSSTLSNVATGLFVAGGLLLLGWWAK